MSADFTGFRDRFYLPPGKIYLDGNSLGLLCMDAEESVLQVLDEWKRHGIDAWIAAESGAWFYLAEEVGALMAPLIGAEPDEVVAANSTTVNFHQILATACDPCLERNRILIDEQAFPSDLYAASSHLRLRGLDPKAHLVRVPTRADRLLHDEDIVAAMKGDVQLAVLPAVVYTTGQLLDIESLTRAAHERGSLVAFDCSHSIGAVPHAFDDWGVDFAFWCSYKYLNGGPGGMAGLYVNHRHFDKQPGLAGWFSADKERQFDMARDLHPARGAGKLQIGSPNILGMAALRGSLKLVSAAGIEQIRRRSLELTGHLMKLVDSELAGFGFSIANPRDNHRRGGHVALVHPAAVQITAALRAEGVIPDHRPPDIIRLCPAPLYNTVDEIQEAIGRLKRIMQDRAYERFPTTRGIIG